MRDYAGHPSQYAQAANIDRLRPLDWIFESAEQFTQVSWCSRDRDIPERCP
jgi:hypothetical protein